MKWQDLVLSCGSLIFSAALVPAIRNPSKPPLSTSAVTSAVLLVFSLVYLSLELWFSAATAALTCVLWGTLAAQKIKQR